MAVLADVDLWAALRADRGAGNGPSYRNDLEVVIVKYQRPAWFTIVFICFATCSSLVHAQTTGTISGTVTDQTGAVIPQASVILTVTNTNATRTVITDSSGHYIGSLLPLGTYNLLAKAPGFRNGVQTGVVLEAQASLTINFTLAPGSASSTIIVRGSAVAVETTNASLGQTIHSQQVADLPLNGRDFVELATMTPGATQGNQPGNFFADAGSSSGETAIRGSYSLSVSGSRQNETDWLYDGVDNNELTAGGIGVQPSIDALQEFRVLTSNYSIRYGTRAGPTVLLTSKAGTNSFHGDLFEFLRNTDLNAFGYFAPTRPVFQQNQFGGSIGGPIKKNKLFFFFDYQGTRLHKGVPSAAQVPTALERQGIFTESFPGSPEVQIYDPATTTVDPSTGLKTRSPFKDNTIPTDRINPIATQLLNLFPLPNVPGALSANYVSVPIATLTDNEFDIRLDWNISNKDTAFARFSRDQATNFTPSGLPDFGTLGATSNQNLSDRARNLAISETHVFSPNAVNQFTAGYNRVFDHIVSYGQGANWNDHFGIPNANLGTFISSGLMATAFSTGYWGLGARIFSPIQDGTNIFQYSDDLEITHGNNLFEIGFETRMMQLNELGVPYGMGRMGFDNLFTAGFTNGAFNAKTGNPVASFLLGLPATGEHDVNFAGEVSGRRWKLYRPYFQDQLKLRKNLTVQLGLAYAYNTTIKEAKNRISNFDFATGQLLIAGVNSSSSAGVKPYPYGFQPRVSIAFSPFSSKNVIHAGYAILNGSGWNLGAQGLDLNPPFLGTFSFASNDITPVTTLSQGFPVPVPPSTTNLSGTVYTMNADFHSVLLQQFNLNIQRALPAGNVLTVGYVGARSSKAETYGWNLNSAPPNTVGINPASLRPYPNLTTITGMLNRGLARYDSLQVKLEKNSHSGLYYLVSYTYSKGFDNGLRDSLGGSVGSSYYPFQPFPHADKGLSATNQTNNFAASLLYMLPFGQGRRFRAQAKGVEQALIGNWQFNLISHMGSGFPLGLTTASNTSGTAITNRPNQVCNEKPAHQSIHEFINTSCFVIPPAGSFGDASPTPLFGPDYIDFDSSLFKNFALMEGTSLSFRTEVFNVFNHPQFAYPGLSVGSASFGRITQTVGNPRLIQFALKFLF